MYLYLILSNIFVFIDSQKERKAIEEVPVPAPKVETKISLSQGQGQGGKFIILLQFILFLKYLIQLACLEQVEVATPSTLDQDPIIEIETEGGFGAPPIDLQDKINLREVVSLPQNLQSKGLKDNYSLDLENQLTVAQRKYVDKECDRLTT